MGRLVAYDLKLLGKAVGAALSRKGDMLFVLIAAPIVAVSAVHVAGEYDLPPIARALLAAIAAFWANLAIGRRSDRLKEHSIVARYALQSREAWRYAMFWNLLPAVASAWLVVTPAPASVARLLLAYAAGAAGASLYERARLLGRRWRSRGRDGAGVNGPAPGGNTRLWRIATLVAGRSGFRRAPLAANIVLFAAAGAAIALLYLWSRGHFAPPGAALAAAVPAAFVVARLQRQHPALLRYLLFVGVMPSGPALLSAAMAAAAVAGALMAGAAAGGEPSGILIGGAALLLFLALVMLRDCHYATRSRQAAAFGVQIDLLAFFIIAFSLPPLAPLLVAARLVMLGRRAGAMRYLA